MKVLTSLIAGQAFAFNTCELNSDRKGNNYNNNKHFVIFKIASEYTTDSYSEKVES